MTNYGKGISKVGQRIVARFHRNGTEYPESFSIQEYGSEGAAVEAAQRYLTDMEAKFPAQSKETGLNIVRGKWMGSHYWNVTYRDDKKKLKSKKFTFDPTSEQDVQRAFQAAEKFKSNL